MKNYELRMINYELSPPGGGRNYKMVNGQLRKWNYEVTPVTLL
jgi:hypothetical protein